MSRPSSDALPYPGLAPAKSHRKIDWERRRFDNCPKITVIEEQKFRDRDAAARQRATAA